MDSLHDEIIPLFKELGFTEYESKVYVCLLSKHPLTAYGISQMSGVPHSRVYDIARRLIKKGAAISVSKTPESFSPLAPDELISKIEKDKDRYILELKKCIKKISFKPDFDPVWNVSKKDEALQMAIDLIKNANHHIYLGLWDEELDLLLPELEAANNRGVKVVFLIYGEKKINFGEVFYHSTENIKHIDTLGRTIDCIVDSRSCIAGSFGVEENSQIVWTRNKGLVKVIEEYIIHDFYIAEIIQKYGKDIEKVFGKNLSLLRKKYDK